MAYTEVDKLAIDDYLIDLTGYTKKSDIINIVAPVGHTMIRLDNRNPGTLPGYEGTTWQKVSEGKMLIGANSSYPLGSTGGSANAVVVEHNHTQNAHNHTQNSHNHTQNAHNHTQNAHNHKPLNPDGTTPLFLSTDKNYQTTSARAYTSRDDNGIRYMYTTETGASHVAENETTANTTATNNAYTATNNAYTATNNPYTATNNPTGVDGTGKNMPPYLAVNIWTRIS